MAVDDKHTLVEGLAAQYGDRLRRYLRTRVTNRADIPDVVQEVFLRLLRVPDHEMIRTPEAYIFTVAQHVAQQWTLAAVSSRGHIELGEMLNELRAATDTDPALSLSAHQCIEALERSLSKLSGNVLATFLLHKRDGMTIDQVSAALGFSRPMTKKYLVKALVSFRRSLKELE